MSTNTTETTSEPSPASEEAAGLPPAFTAPQIENVLTLDLIMSSARKARRVAKICLRGDLEAEYLEVLDLLSERVDAEGRLLNEDDQSMEEAAEVADLRDRASALRDQMAAETYSVVFEGMDADEWDVFEAARRDGSGKIKSQQQYNTDLIVACAVEPKLSESDVKTMRKRLRPTQMTELANKAFEACATGGVDVPKLPTFWHSPKPQES